MKLIQQNTKSIIQYIDGGVSFIKMQIR